MFTRKLLTLFAMTLLFFCTASASSAQDFASRFSVIDELSFVMSDSDTLPGPGAEWNSLDLPLGLRLGNSDNSDQVIWMKFPLEKPQSSELHSLYFHRYNLSIDVYLNGEKIGGDTYKEGRFTTSWNHPRIIDINNASWKDAENMIQIRFKASYYGGTFGQIVFGKTEALRVLYEDTLFKRVGINSWLQLIGILVTALSLALWITRRIDNTYLLLAGMAAAWTVLTTHMVVYYNFIDYQYWLPLVHLAMHCFGLLYFKLLCKLNDYQNPQLNKLILIWFIAAVCWNQFGSFVYWWMGTYIFHAIGNLFSVFMLTRIAHSAIKSRDKLSVAISITVMVQLLFFVHDFLLILFGSDAEWETGIYFTQFAFPLLLVVFAGILLERFRSALSLAENLNKDLEAKVEASRQLIEQSYAKTRQLELDQASEKQRLAIYRDLHDDVGSKLLSIVHAGTDSKLGELARGALESLRNAVSKANSSDQSLSVLLEGIHEETQLRLEGSGHTLDWRSSESLPQIIVPADNVFNITQVFRELVSNIIRHANAELVTVEISTNEGAWNFSLSDDGVGFDSSNPPGNGLKNIAERIKEVSGNLTWSAADPSGTSVFIKIPIEDDY